MRPKTVAIEIESPPYFFKNLCFCNWVLFLKFFFPFPSLPANTEWLLRLDLFCLWSHLIINQNRNGSNPSIPRHLCSMAAHWVSSAVFVTAALCIPWMVVCLFALALPKLVFWRTWEFSLHPNCQSLLKSSFKARVLPALDSLLCIGVIQCKQ